jgi:hypothetical protein
MTSQEYLESCLDSYCSEKDKAKTLKYNLKNSWNSIRVYCGDYPDAEGFLIAQKTFWHNIRLKDLVKEGYIGNHFGKAQYFLTEAEPIIDKHMRLKDILEEFYQKTVHIGMSTETLVNCILRERNPKIIFPPEKLESNERTFLESSIDDLKFLNYYKQRAMINWHLQAGYWPHIIEPEEGKDSRQFYSKVSDFMLCMVDGISELERQVKIARYQKLKRMGIN